MKTTWIEFCEKAAKEAHLDSLAHDDRFQVCGDRDTVKAFVSRIESTFPEVWEKSCSFHDNTYFVTLGE